MKKYLSIASKSLSELGVATYKELWEKAVGDGYEGLSVCVATVMTKAAEKDNLYHAVFSTDSEDRHGDIVRQDFDLKYFKKNPVFLDSHNYDSITHILGKIHGASTKSGSLEGDIEFMLDNPKGVLAQQMVEKGFLNTTSIGFIPKVFSDKGEILKSELLEVSAVSVPAQAEALFEKKTEEVQETKVVEEPEVKADEPVKINRRSIAVAAVTALASEQKAELKMIAKCVTDLTEGNKQETKRKIYQAIRNLINE